MDVDILREKLDKMGVPTKSNLTKVPMDIADRLIKESEERRAAINASKQAGKPAEKEKKREGVIKRVKPATSTEPEPEVKKPQDSKKVGVADSGLRTGLTTVKEDAEENVNSKPAEKKEDKPAANSEEKPKTTRKKAVPKDEGETTEKKTKKKSEKTADDTSEQETETEDKKPVKKTKTSEKAKDEDAEAPETEKKEVKEVKEEPEKADDAKKPKEEEKAPAEEPKKKMRAAGLAGGNESLSISLGGSSVSETREAFSRARIEEKNRPAIRRETAAEHEARNQRRPGGQGNRDFQKNNGFNRDNRNGGNGQNRDNKFGGYRGGDMGKDKDEQDDKRKFTKSSNQNKPAKQIFTSDMPQDTHKGKTGEKDNAKKEQRKESNAHRGETSKGGKDRYRNDDMFINSRGASLSDIENDYYDAKSGAKKMKKKDAMSEAARREADAARKEAMKLTKVKIPPTITVGSFAELIKKKAPEVIKKLFGMGMLATVNQEIDFDTAALIASEFEIEAEPEIVLSNEEILLEDPDDLEEAEDTTSRPPVVVVMGHVDHGKTSLLDAIRNTSVTAGEAGGITQHIGAYTVNLKDHMITFLDTPGHEAFTAMRARGAQVTDVAIIVVAADDGVMPQTIEAINHAKAAEVPIVVAVNKIDKEGANPDKVITEMAEQGVVCEEWGGDTPFVQISAKKGLNIDLLLETVLLTADIRDLKASPTKQCKGTIIEAKLDKNKGPVATLLVQRGTLRPGDAILSETTFGHIRTMTNDKGRTIKAAGPSTPVEITGLPEVPEAGKVFYVVNKDEKLAKKIVDERIAAKRKETSGALKKPTSLEGLFSEMKAGEVKDLNIIVKADVKGSAEAIKASLEKLSNDEVRVVVIHNGVGGVNESDVLLAEASNAVIIGFNVRPVTGVDEIANEKGVDMKLYRVIYDAIDDVKAAMIGMLKPEYKENVIGHVEVRQTFKISGVGTIAGGYVLNGKIVRNSEARIVRNDIVIYEGHLSSLKRFKDDVKEVAAGFECGLSFEKFDDIKEGDVIESYVMEEIKRTL